MTIYGIVLGMVAGVLVSVVILAYQSTTDISSIVGTSIVVGVIFGALAGGVSGFCCGLVMMIVTAVAFRELRNRKRLRLIMGLITTGITGGFFVVGGFTILAQYMELPHYNQHLGVYPSIDLPWASAMIMSVVIAVYASQIVTRKYIEEMSPRKEKFDT